jgi:serine-type D-Ala-D-Ala carboxypeptidase (penicillin-binding protein 5/6)
MSLGTRTLRVDARRGHVPVLWLAVIVGLGLGLALAAGRAPAAQAATVPQLSVRSAILFEPQTGQVLFSDQIDRELPIASTTKLMTALVTLQHVHDLNEIFTQPDYVAAPSDSQIGLEPGERMSVHDLMLALMLPSADDAAEDLAYNVGHGSVSRFVAMMNTEARQLGLSHTHYSTPIGLDTPGNYSTAADLVKLASYDLTHSVFLKRIVALPHAVLKTGSHVRYVVNRNDLVGQYPWINGVKTGHTDGAGYVLVASGRRHGMPLLSAVLGTSSEESRDDNTLALLNYGFSNFHLLTPVREGQVLARPTVHYRPGAHARLVAARPFTRVFPNSTRIRVAVKAPGQLTGPLRRGTRHGVAIVTADGHQVARIPLLLAKALPAVSPLTIAARFMAKPTMLLILALLVFVPALAFLLRRRRRAQVARGFESA